VVSLKARTSLFESYHTTPFMTLTFQVRPEKKAAIAAAVHVDGSARVQTVRRDQNERYYDLIKAFAAKTGVPAVLNTSFNLKGEPIAKQHSAVAHSASRYGFYKLQLRGNWSPGRSHDARSAVGYRQRQGLGGTVAVSSTNSGLMIS
jgi:predicted NodU family carbamoyl transferase